MTRDSTIVLDTNVVLDWLVFGNVGVQPLARAIESGRLTWVASQPMRDELSHVLAREALAHWNPHLPRLWAAWDSLSRAPQAASALRGEALRLRCSDPDDQKFIDLALASSRWLISRDRAVLKLARRAAPLGVQILTPERWQLDM